ncbi:MAG TPA: Rossmann fold nucleotide-binding protein [Propionibacterium sp.]|nr:Rossmann fold nucleotide-binding protein [Propionibacterium sp.]
MERTFLEIESLAEFDAHIAIATHLDGWLVQSVDLSERSTELRRVDPAGAMFLGCTLTDRTHLSLVRRGAHVFPRLGAVPFNPYRARLYTAAELYDTPHYADSLDARVYDWLQSRLPHPALPDTLAMTLHDHAVTDALDELHIARDATVGIMGGHKLRRDEEGYAAAAHLSATLTERGAVVLTGGGPGAMEAANLGARYAGCQGLLDDACAELARVPSFLPDIDAWAASALSVLDHCPADAHGVSIGIPTWHFGHEPPNVFATHIAKYFHNALREDELLRCARAGIVCLPGAAGTVQEIFQATTINYYATDAEPVVPMVLVGRAYWTDVLPAWQLLSALGAGRRMEHVIHLVDDPAEVPELLRIR